MTKPVGLSVCPRCGGSGETLAYDICPVCDGEGEVPVATRRGEATNREAQAPLPASVSATPEGSQRGLSGD